MAVQMTLSIFLPFAIFGLAVSLCPGSYVQHGSSCYYFGTDTMTWDKAKEACWFMEGYLAEIDNAEEEKFLEQKALHDHNGYWLGGRDEVEGHWKWDHSGKAFTYTNWYPGEPNNINGKEDCLHIATGTVRHWNDVDCNQHLPYVCEMSSFGPIG